MHSFVKPGLFHISAETTECLIFCGLKTFKKVACFFLVAFVLAIITASQRDYNRRLQGSPSISNRLNQRGVVTPFLSSSSACRTNGASKNRLCRTVLFRPPILPPTWYPTSLAGPNPYLCKVQIELFFNALRGIPLEIPLKYTFCLYSGQSETKGGSPLPPLLHLRGDGGN